MMHVNSALQELLLYKCSIGDDGMLALVDAIVEGHPTVTVLDLGRHVPCDAVECIS